MKITTVLFDLDGTLLPMDQDVFTEEYLKKLVNCLSKHGYDPNLLIKTIWTGIKAMLQNDGSKTNEETFWDSAVMLYGEKLIEDKHIFDDFYAYEFDSVKKVCGFDIRASETVRTLRKKGYRIVLATNPLFPSMATEWRIKWTGLMPSDFEFYTAYENSNYCKPNLKYYSEVIDTLGVNAEECIMVGNDVDDDMIAENLGMKVFLLTDNLINKNGKDISRYPHGSFPEFFRYLDRL